MTEKILILDFGSQYTQLIARNIRDIGVYCEIIPYWQSFTIEPSLKGIILSGSPFSVNEPHAPVIDLQSLSEEVPVLGICYGAQLIATLLGGIVAKSNKREYGRASLKINEPNILFEDVMNNSFVWMSHSDSIISLPVNFHILASTESIPIAAFKYEAENSRAVYGLQFHPEVTHSSEGKKILTNFVVHVCHCHREWTPMSFIEESVETLKEVIGKAHVVMALSGGVDSTIAATLLHKAIGKQFHGIFINNGLLRKNEFEDVLHTYHQLNLQVKGIDASKEFYKQLKGVTEPEAKRKVIGKTFIEFFNHEAESMGNVQFLCQGTIYPDVIESMSVYGPSATIKSHHNVGGLPENMSLQIVEPLRYLFKDEVRKVGIALGIPSEIVYRHPFPGPGLAIRILGEVTPEKVNLLQEADNIFISQLKEQHLYETVWQAGAILLPVKSVGVMGDERTYEYTLALRAVTSIDGMTADWAHLPYEFLSLVSNKIINEVKGINRVVYDISSKPPATIEWE